MSTSNTDSRAPEVRLVSLSEIRLADGANPRRRFDEQALNELAASIGQHGVLQPLVVSSEDGGYTLIAGERRYRAAKLAGLTQVPVSIHDAGDAGDRARRRREPAPPGPRPGRGGARLPGDPPVRTAAPRSSWPSGSASRPST